MVVYTLSQLLMTKGSTGSELITRLKMPEKDTIQAIEKLLDATHPLELMVVYTILYL